MTLFSLKNVANAHIDPGEPLGTPAGTGRLGAPDGNVGVWGPATGAHTIPVDDDGAGVGSMDDGTIGGNVAGDGSPGYADGTGTR